MCPNVPIACLLAAPVECQCTRSSAVVVADMFGEHEQSCKSHNRNLRHNNILDALI
eukprot:SAG11_NODE_130_length_15497_cov_10.780556_20_plen_55_part_01